MMKRFFYKRFKNFFLIMIIPTVVMFCISLVYLDFNDKKVIQKNAEYTLANVNQNIDLVITNAIYQQDLMTVNPSLVVSLWRLLTRDSIDYADYIFLNSMRTILSSIAESHPYIDSTYLYLDGYDNFLSSHDGVSTVYGYYDNAWYDTYRNADPEVNQWIESRNVRKYAHSQNTEVITIYQRMTYMHGVIIVNILADQLEDILNLLITDPDEKFYLLNADNSILVSNTGDLNLDSTFSRDLFRMPTEEPAGESGLKMSNGHWVEAGGRKYLLNLVELPEYGIRLVSLYSSNARLAGIQTVLFWFGLVIGLNCMIVVALAYVTTRRSFRQIYYMIQLFTDAENGIIHDSAPNAINDEYDVIMNNILSMYVNTTHIKHELTEKKYQQQVAELAALQLQINPHFLFNTLQTLDFEVMKSGGRSEAANRIISDLSDILKYSLADPMVPVALRDELSYLKKYVEIQQFRFGNRFIVYYDVDDSLMDYKVFRLMLQPLIENSIHHGVRSLGSTGYIKLKIFPLDGKLHFHVIDTGAGMDPEEVQSLRARIADGNSKSIGLTNVNRRLVIKYGPDSGLVIRSKKGLGTSVSFAIPIP